MIGVGMADQYYIRFQFGQRIAHGILKEWVQEDGDVLLTLQQKTGVSEPFYYHDISFSALWLKISVDPGIDDGLKDFIAKKKESMPDAFT